MRRGHCEINDSVEKARVLNSTTIGRLATKDREGYPYITPVNFVFHEGKIYFHCAPAGEKLDNIIRDNKVCFEVDVPLAYVETGFNDTRNPCQAHQLFQSVIIRGKARVVRDDEEKTKALNALTARHEPDWDFTPVTPDSPAYRKCLVVAVEPERMTGKADLVQNKSEEFRRDLAEKLLKRGRPGDVATVKAMGFGMDDDGSGPRVKP